MLHRAFDLPQIRFCTFHQSACAWGNNEAPLAVSRRTANRSGLFDGIPVREQEPRLPATTACCSIRRTPMTTGRLRRSSRRARSSCPRPNLTERLSPSCDPRFSRACSGRRRTSNLSRQVHATPRSRHAQSPPLQLFGNLHHGAPPRTMRSEGSAPDWHSAPRAEAVAKNRTARARDLTIEERRAIASSTVIIKSWRHLVMCICRQGG